MELRGVKKVGQTEEEKNKIYRTTRCILIEWRRKYHLKSDENEDGARIIIETEVSSDWREEYDGNVTEIE